LTLIVIISRLWYRRVMLKRFRGDDKWMAVAGFFLIATSVSQIGSSVNDGGLHMVNVPDNVYVMHWYFSIGWCGYYVVTSCIKLSVCFLFLELLPHHLRTLRYCVFVLCFLIASLGLTMTFTWLFECTPALSNFVYSIDSDTCINHDIMRFIWIGCSVAIDCVLLLIPVGFLRRVNLRDSERRILKMVFSATLLGTAICITEIYGVYEDRIAEALDTNWHEVVWLMLNDIEIFMYAIGASFPVLSRYLVSRNAGRRVSNENFSSWGRRIPNFFSSTKAHLTREPEHVASQDPEAYVLGVSKSVDESEQGHSSEYKVSQDIQIISEKVEGSESSQRDMDEEE